MENVNVYIELIGIAASVFILASFVLSGETKIRSVNIFGAVLFVIYGIMKSALSIWLMNSVLFMVHCYKLIRLYTNEKTTRKDNEN